MRIRSVMGLKRDSPDRVRRGERMVYFAALLIIITGVLLVLRTELPWGYQVLSIVILTLTIGLPLGIWSAQKR